VYINKDYAGINAYMKLKLKLRKDLITKVELMKNNKFGDSSYGVFAAFGKKTKLFIFENDQYQPCGWFCHSFHT